MFASVNPSYSGDSRVDDVVARKLLASLKRRTQTVNNNYLARARFIEAAPLSTALLAARKGNSPVCWVPLPNLGLASIWHRGR